MLSPNAADWISRLPAASTQLKVLVRIMMIPVAVHTNKVSMYTENAWIRPCFAGWDTSAEPAEGVAVDIPVSDE